MTAVALWLLQNALVATTASLLLILALRRWTPATRVEHLLWLLIAMKFLMPPVAHIPVPLLGDVAPHAFERSAPLPPGVRNRVGTEIAGSTSGAALPGDNELAREAAPLPDGRPHLSRAGVAWRAALTLWALGSLVALLVQVGSLARWRRRRRLAPAPPALVMLVADVARALRMRPPDVVLDATLDVPVVVGPLRPQLLWPARLLNELPSDGARMVIAHELAHVRRGDLWVGGLELLANSVWWWYPGWHMVRRQLRDTAERACDARAVALYPGLRRSYANTMLDIMSSAARPRAALALSGSGSVRRRLQAVMTDQPASRRGRRAVLVAIVLLAPGWTLARSSDSGIVPAAASIERQVPARVEIVEALAIAARDREAEVRRAVANALRDIGGERAVAALNELVGDPDEQVARAARAALGLEPPRPNLVFGGESERPALSSHAVDSLGALLTRGDPRARLAAANTLGNYRDARSIAVLIAALRDEDFHVRQSAAGALGGRAASEAVPHLVRLLEDPHPRVRQNAAGALGAIGSDQAVPALLSALRDDDPHVRRVAVSALARITAE